LPLHQRSLHGGCAPAHEWVENYITGLGQPCYEEFRQLRLEAGTIGHLMDRVRLTLARRPKLVDQVGNAFNGLRHRRLAEVIKCTKVVHEGFGGRRELGPIED
jgi:hypothetical protein